MKFHFSAEGNMAGYYMDPFSNQARQNGGDNTDNNEGKLFVGGLAWESSDDSIRTYFERFGPVESVNLKKNKEDVTKHRGFAFVKFVHAEDADKVLNQKTGHIIDGSKVDAKSACPLGVKPAERTKKIFVGGLQAETTEEKLRDYFSQFGEIQNNIEFALDRNTNKRRGFCFIEFANESVVDRIVKDKFHEVAGKRLETKRALSKQQQEQQADDMRRKMGQGMMYSMPVATTPYAQPVIYIHPDSLSTAYPLSAVGVGGLGAAGGAYAGVAPAAYTTSLEQLYSPYGGRDNRALYHGSWRLHPPNSKPPAPTKSS